MTNRLKHRWKRTWSYYTHADNLQHSRQVLFLTVQGASLAGFGVFLQTENPQPLIAVVFAVFGFVHALLWFALTQTVRIGMDRLNAELVKIDLTYATYLRDVRPLGGALSGRWVLGTYLPILAGVVWIVLAAMYAGGYARAGFQGSPASGAQVGALMQIKQPLALNEIILATVALVIMLAGLLLVRECCIKETQRWPSRLFFVGLSLIVASGTALTIIFWRILSS